jgi:DNA polymerase-3 subunit epsilon/ATP-dependent DNA helicase DinG
MPSTYVAIDLETTGLDPNRESIIEIGAVTFSRGQIHDEWSSLVNPLQPIPEFITNLTGINQKMVDDAPAIFSLRSQIKQVLGDHILVGHNVSFDLGFLRAENLALGNHRLDTLTLASILMPGAGRYGLNALANTLQLPRPPGSQAHRALDDARRAADLFMALQQLALELDFDILNEITQSGNNLGWPETIFFEDALRAIGSAAFGSTTGSRLARLFQPAKPDSRQLAPAKEPREIDLETISAMLQPGGNFSRHFTDYEYRPQQVEMLDSVIQAFNYGQHLIVEAGTGTGKSIGYLLPAAFWASENNRRVVVSTNTINLQDQLLNKDLPELGRILPFEVRGAVLKGKRNYLCTRLFQQMRHSGPGNADEMVLYARLLVWLPHSATGDTAEITQRTPGERLAWDRLNAENDACTAEKCAQEGCPLHYARRHAEQSHILVVNHALLLADVAASNRVLPEYVDLIIDEAHHLESAVTNGLSFRADRRFLESLLDEVNKPRAGLVADMQRRVATLPDELSLVFDNQAIRLRESGQLANVRLEEFFSSLDYFLNQFVNRRSQYSEQVRFTEAVRTQPDYDEVVISWDNLNKLLKIIGEGLGKLAGGVADVSDAYDIEDAEELRLALVSLARNTEETRFNIDAMFTKPVEEMIYWAEVFKSRISLNAAPLNIGPLVEQHIFNAKETVVLTSATLQTSAPSSNGEQSFNYLKDRLHAQHAEELSVGSPFNYKSSTLVYLPTDIPEPKQPGYQRYVNQAIIDLAIALDGRTMVLFTSYSQLRSTAQAIEQPLANAGLSLLSQAEGGSRQRLLEQFKMEDSRSVLLGTRSFWEGVDVPGRALQAVMIAKLPFDVPSDPVFSARSETFDYPFFEYSIPEAVLRFRQGFGRLIRRQNDEGVVVILDKRVLTKRYGQAFIEALPECTILRQRIDRLGELSVRWMNREKDH